MTPPMTSRVSSKVDQVLSQANKLWDYDCLQRNPLIALEARNKKSLAGYDDERIERSKYLGAYTRKKNSAIASRATTIGSAGRAPDEINIRTTERR
jgi:hypothetical protein